MGGFLFRLGVSLKDKGEQWKCDWLIRLGLGIREFVLRHGVIENENRKVKICLDYKNFYLAIRRYAKKRISRRAFITDWRDAQRSQGIEAGKGGRWRKN